jgi:hypothetical protein
MVSTKLPKHRGVVPERGPIDFETFTRDHGYRQAAEGEAEEEAEGTEVIWTIAAGVVIGGLALGIIVAGIQSMMAGEASPYGEGTTIGCLFIIGGLLACALIVAHAFHFI